MLLDLATMAFAACAHMRIAYWKSQDSDPIPAWVLSQLEPEEGEDARMFS